MSFNLRAKFRNTQSRLTMKETNTIKELKEAISKSIFIPIEQQRIIYDWKEALNDEMTLQEAGITKKSKITIFEKKNIVDHPENQIYVLVEYNEEQETMIMNKDHYFIDLILMFFQNHPFPEKMDDIKLKQKSKNIKLDQLIQDFQNYQQNPVKIIISDKTDKKKKGIEEKTTEETTAKEESVIEENEPVSTPVSISVSTSITTLTDKPEEEKKEKTPKKERVMKKEKTPKKDKVMSMNIMSFLKHSKKTEDPVTSKPATSDKNEITVISDSQEKQSVDENSPREMSFIDVQQDQVSMEELLQQFKERMNYYNQESKKREEEMKQLKEKVIVSLEEKKEEMIIETKDNESDSETEDEETAVLEIVDENEEDYIDNDNDNEEKKMEVEDTNDIIDITPQLFTETTVPTKHMIMTINKNNLTSSQLLSLPHLLGFRYIHPDTDTDKSKVLFGISHATSQSITGRNPFGQDNRIDYTIDSDESDEEGLNDDDIQGDDCNDTESDSSEAEETVNRLDYGDGFLAEEDINIGDANLTAEEKSALVFRSVSGNKGKLNQQVKLSNQPFMCSSKDGPVMGIDLSQCKTIICDPIFFNNAITTMKKNRLEIAVGEKIEKQESTGNETPKTNRKINISDEMVEYLKELILGQSWTITQINDKMQEKYPGLPKRQIENKLHEIAEKRHRVWYLRNELPTTTPIIETKQSTEIRSFPIDLDKLMTTHGSPLPPREESRHKREHFEEELSDNPDEAIITTVSLTTNSHSEKRQRIQPERIPDGTILQGNISHSAFAIDPHDDGPSSFNCLM